MFVGVQLVPPTIYWRNREDAEREITEHNGYVTTQNMSKGTVQEPTSTLKPQCK